MNNIIDYDLVSIITPSWNCGRFIAETIRSVQAQTYQHWELLIQDDCSTDNTREIVTHFAYEDRRIKYEHNTTNSGAAVTRNRALRRAKGRWIAFLDSDDLWSPHKLEYQLRFMKEHGYVFSYHEYTEISEDGKKLGIVVSGPSKITKTLMYAYCWQGCLTVMYDACAIGLIQIEDLKKNNDYAMWLKVCQQASCYLMPQIQADYRLRSGSISRHRFWKLVIWHYKLFRIGESMNAVSSSLLTVLNLFCGVTKRLIYKKRVYVS